MKIKTMSNTLQNYNLAYEANDKFTYTRRLLNIHEIINRKILFRIPINSSIQINNLKRYSKPI